MAHTNHHHEVSGIVVSQTPSLDDADHRRDAEAQAGGLHHPVYGGGRQGDLGNEAFCRSFSCSVTTGLILGQLNARARFVAESFLTPVSLARNQ